MPAEEPRMERPKPDGEERLVETETPYAEEVASLQDAIESGQDPTANAKFLLYLIEGSVDPGLSGDERKRALGSAVAKVYPQMSELAREVFAKTAGMDLVPNDDKVTDGSSESPESDDPVQSEDDAGTVTPNRPELTPPPIPEITADINGSKIRVIDPDEILRLAQRDGKVEIYNKSDFKTKADDSIERVTAAARVNAKDNTIILGTNIELNPTISWNMDSIKARFKHHFPRQDESEYLKRDGLLITPTKFNNSYIVKDENGAVFEVLIYANDKKVKLMVYNYNMSTDKETKVPTPTLDQVDALEQLKSLGRVTALVADLCATLRTGWPDETDEAAIDTKRRYVLEHQLRREYVFKANSIEHLAAALDDTEAERSTGKEGISFKDIGGYDGVKRQLENAALMLSNPDIARRWDSKPPNGILLYGPPGTGKTMLAEAFAHETGANFVLAGSTEIYDMWIGNSGKNLVAIFDKARATKGRVVLFFDEIESFISKSTYDDTRNDIAGIFKTEMTKLAVSNPNIIVVAATNDLDRLDPSIVRPGRFDKKIEVPLPNDKDRTDIITVLIAKSHKAAGGFRIFAEGIVPVELVNVSDGFSGADIVEVLNRLKVERAIREANHEPVTPISQQEILEEMGRYREEKEDQRPLDI